mmetsp:Transcript_57340/g.112890  ORF Transcript_57340/g.112890 Transcript_57340/m.112890 type:complete len:753 (+) Transcript_57340:109-2367(+)
MSDALYDPIMGEQQNNYLSQDSTDDVDEAQSDQYGNSPRVSIEYDEEFENLVNSLMRDKDKISVNQAALNITYTIINAGLIAIPFTAYNAGIPLFIAVVVIMSLISGYVAVMVINMANQKKVRTLEDLAEVCGGPNFFLCVCAFQILFSFSMMCVTLAIWADVMSDVFSSSSLSGGLHHLLATRRGEVLVGATIVLPLCVFKRSMISLRWTAYLTVCAVAFCMSAVVIAFFAHKEGPSLDTSAMDLITPQSEWWTVMFVVVFCFSYNQRVFAVYRCLKRRNTDRWTHAVAKASTCVTVLYLLFGIAGYLTMARKGIKLDNFNFFLDDRGENIVLYNVARVVVVSSLLLTIPVDSLIASSTWRRLYSRYTKLTAPKYHHPSDTASSSASHQSRNAACCTDADGGDGTTDNAMDETVDRQYQSEDTEHQRPTSSQLSHSTSSVSTANEFGHQLLTGSQDVPIASSASSAAVVDVLVQEQQKTMACSPPITSLSHLNRLMNEPPVPAGMRRSPSASSVGSLNRSSEGGSERGGGGGGATDRRSFTSTSTGTGGASTTTGSGVAGNRMISKDEMESILRANSFDTKTPGKTKSQHGRDSEYEAEMEAGLDSSWLSNASLSYDSGREVRDLAGVIQSPSDKNALLIPGISPLRGRMTPLLLWGLCTATCIGVNHWMYIAATVGTISTTMLLFIFPTMFYFRMTLASDFGATPIFGRLVPNALYMGLIQAIGIAILLCDFLAIAYLPMTGHHIIRDET